MKRLFACTIALLMLLPPARARADQEEIPAGGAILIEAGTGRVLYEKDADVPLPMASTTKVMTALLAIERGGLDEIVTVPDCAYGVEGSSMYLNRGERILLRDLLYGLMLTSGNDAAVAIAVHIAGSVEDFAGLMNARAAELGCENTHFVTPNGLHDEAHYTAARDLAAISAAAMELSEFAAIVNTEYYETTSGDRVRTLKNKNKTLWQYDGGCGVKTGYTKAAGKCLVFSAKRGDTLLIGVLLKARDMWKSAFELLDYGFALVKTERLLVSGQRVATASVSGGVKKELAAAVKDDILYPIRRDGSDEIALAVKLLDAIEAPVAARTVIGSITLYVNGEDVATTALTAAESIAKRRGADRLREWLLDLVS